MARGGPSWRGASPPPEAGAKKRARDALLDEDDEEPPRPSAEQRAVNQAASDDEDDPLGGSVSDEEETEDEDEDEEAYRAALAARRTQKGKQTFMDEERERVRAAREKVIEEHVAAALEPLRKKRRERAREGAGELVGGQFVFDDGSGNWDGAMPELDDKYGGEVEHMQAPHPAVPKVPFTWNVLGPSGQGKTTMVVRLLTTELRGVFDHVFFFVPSFYQDDQWRHIKHDPARVFTRWAPEDFQVIHTHQRFLCTKERESKGKLRAPQVLIVIDDSMGYQHSGPKLNALDELYSYGRKSKVSIMNLAQRFKGQLSATIRRNATASSIFDLFNHGEYEAVREEMRRPGVSKKQFDAMYKAAVTSRDKGGFLHIDRMPAAGAPYSSNMVEPYPLQ